VSLTAMGRMGQTGCEGTEWESETSVRCLVGHGSRETRRLTLTTGERGSSMSEAYSLDARSLSVMRRSNHGSTGTASVTVHGSSLGSAALTAMGRMGQTGCEGTEWESETSVRCLVGHGARGTRRVAMTAGDRSGSMSGAYSSDMTGASMTSRGNRAGTGSASVTVHGSGLGLVSLTAMGRMGQTGCEGTEWESETSVRCLVGLGIQGTRRTAVTAGRQDGTGSAMYTMDQGSLSITRESNRAGTGSASVTVHGAGLGLVSLTAMGRMGQTGCEGTEWESETAVRCLVGNEIQGTRRVAMTAGERDGTGSAMYTMDVGSLSATRESNRAGTGSARVTVHGAGLGLVSLTAMGRMGLTGCEGTEWESETSVRCLVGHGARGTRRVAMTAGERGGSSSVAMSLDSGSVSVSLQRNRAGTGSASVTVHGSGLGLVSLTAMGRMGQTGCEGTEWESETSVRCLVGHGSRETRRLTLTTGERGGSMSEAYSLDARSLSVMRRSNHGSTGTASVTVHGSSLGSAALTAMGRMGQTGCEGTEWESETSVRCLVGHGARGTRRVAMTAGDRSGSMSEAYSSDMTGASMTSRGNRAGTGSASVTVHGSGLGLVSLTAMGRMGQTGCEGTEWESETSVRCLGVHTIQSTRRVAMTSGEREGTGSAMYTMDVGSLSITRESNRAGTGSASVTVHGSGLGLVSLTAMGRMGQTGCEGTEWESETSVRCLVGHGARGTRRVAMTAGERGMSSSAAVSFDSGSVSVSLQRNRAGTGSASVTVHGSGLGLVSLTAMGRMGQTGCEGTEWESETSVRCLVGHGSRETRRLTLTTGERGGSMSEAYSLDARSLSVMRRSNHGSTGTASVTVHGSSLGSAALTAMGRMGQTGCEGTEWESETSVRCLVGHGARGTRRVAMTAGDRSGSMSGAYSSDMTGASMTSRGNRAGTGSASVTVHGSGLGLVSLTAMGRMGQTGCEGTEWESETSVRCLLGLGIQGTRRMALTAGRQDGTGSAMYTMDVGSLSITRESNRAGTGSASVTVHGAGLGLVSLTAMGRMGQTGCEGTEWESETSVRCLVGHGARGTRRMALTAGQRGGSSSAAVSFDSGIVSVSLQRNRAGTGSASVTVHGSGLGLVSLTAMGRMGQTGCEGTEWESETSVRCLVGHGSRETRRLTLTTGERGGSMSEAYSLDARSLSVMRRSNHGSTGTASVTVHGSSLGSAALTAMGRMGQTGCEGTEWESETSVRCLVGHGARGTRRVAMTVGDRSGSMSETYSSDIVGAGMTSRGNRAGTGSALVTVDGSGLGLVSLTAMGRMGQTGCEGTEWESETSVRCLVGRGIQGTRRMAITACEWDGTGSAMYTMDGGSLSATRESNRAGTGSASVTVHGAGLGLVSLTAMGRMGQTGCEGTEWESETSVRCLVGHGARGTRRVSTTAGERDGSSSAAVSWDSGRVIVSLQRNRAGTGSASVTVHGSGLGLVSLTAMGRMGQTGCEGTEWESETSVRCLVGHGSRETRRLTLTTGERGGSMSGAYSLDARSLSVMRRSNHGSTGTASVTVHGSSLGSAALTAMGRMGQTGCEGTEWESETSVRCLVGHGARGTRRVAMTAGDRSGSMSGAYSSDMTGASMTSRGNRAGTGSASVTVHGSGLGLVSLTAMGRMGQTGCEGTEWESETSVRCLGVWRIQGTRRLAVTACERYGTGSAMFTMDVGSLSATRESNRAGTGSKSVTVHGSGLGLVSLTAMGRMGLTGCEGTEWESETSVRCLVGHGARGTRRVAMTAGERDGSSSAAMSIDSGSVSVSLQRNRAGTGSASVTVHGSGLGLVSLTAMGRMGQTGCEGTEWESETSVRCLVGHGSRETRRLTLTTGERGGSMSEAHSLDARSLSVMRRSNHGSTGTASVTVHGSSLGSAALTAMGRMGQTGCEGTEWESETSVRCLVGHGARGTRRVAMTAGDRSGSMSGAYSSDMTGASMTSRGNRAGTGSASVTVHGSGLGLVSLTAMGRMGQTGCEGTEWESETSVRCLVGRGIQGTRRWALTTGERDETGSAMYTMDVGSLSNTRESNRAGTGSASVTVHGAGLGLVSLTAMGRMGQTGCEGTEWESETSVRCLVGLGVRRTRRVAMTAAERGGSSSAATSLDSGSVSVSLQRNREGTGSASVTVHGSGLGLVSLTAMGRMGQTGCEGTEWESETSVRCLVGHGSRETRRLTLTTGERGGSMSEAYSLDARSLSVMRRGNHGSTGTASVTVHGSSLGSAALTAMGRMGQTGCEGTEWESETSVRCLVGHGARGTRRLAMTAGDRSGSMSGAYSSDMKGASMTSRGNRAGTGSASVTVHGSGLGLVSLTAMGRMGQTGCERTEWESETSVRCLVGHGSRHTRRLTFTTGDVVSSMSEAYSIDVRSLSLLRRSNSGSTGTASMTVHGSSLSSAALTAMGRMGQTGCEGTEWESETSVRCILGFGMRGTRRLAMTAGERGGSSSEAMSFDSETVSVSLQRNRAGTGSASMTVHGSGLGLVSLTAMGRMGQTGCEGTEWESETSVRCLVGQGSRETRRLTLTSSALVGSMSEAYSLDARSLSLMRRSNHGSTGTASVTVHGSSLGSAALTAMGRMGQTGCEGTEWESETSVRCLVGHGARGTRRVAMTAGDRSRSMSEAYSFDVTVASMTSRGNRAGTGLASVTVHGSGLGLVSLTAMGRMGQTGCEGTEWESETSVRCLVGRGIQGTRRVAITAGERDGTGSAMFTMDVGSLSITRESNRAGTGSGSVTVHGAGLGLVSLTAMGRMGLTGCEGTEWESETSVRCLKGIGVRGSRRVAMTAGERGGSSSAAVSFDSGSVSVSLQRNRAGTGSASVTVHGSGLGLVSLTAMGRMGQTGCEGTEWESETSVRCLVGHGSRETRRLTFTSGERGGSMSEAYSLDARSLSVMRRSNHGSTGTASVTVHGSSLGSAALTAMGRMGQTGCEGTEWESETSVRCLVGHGARGTRRVAMTAGDRSGSMSGAYSSDMTGASMTSRGNRAGTGSASVTVHGSGLGLVSLTAMGRMGQTGCEGTEWESETSVRCLVGRGIQGTCRVAITAGERDGTGSAMYTMDVGSLSTTRESNRAGTGSASVTVHGSGLGLVSLTAMGRIGQTGCEGTEWESETSVRCLVGHGARGTRRVAMTAGEQCGSSSAATSLDSGSVSVSLQRNRAGTGSASVTVHGSGLGLVSLTAMGRMGQTGCEGTEWESETSVRCLVGHGSRETRRLTLTTGERGGSMSEAHSLDARSLSVMRPSNHGSTGTASVTVHGSSLGSAALTAMGRMGQTGCEGTEWESETSVRCLVGHGARGTRRLAMTAGDRSGSMSEAYSIDVTGASMMSRGNRAGTGSASVTVHGSGLGLVSLTAMGRMGQTGCEGTEWESETSVRCLVGRGIQGTRRVAMTAGERDGTGSAMYSMDVGSLSATWESNRAGTGSASVTVHGAGLGLVSLTAMGRIGQTGCEGTEWESETSVRCLVGLGVRGTRRVAMTAGERGGSSSAAVSLDSGSVSVSLQRNRAGTGSASVTVHGSGLGIVSLTAMGRMGQTGCEGTEWESETSVRCLVGHGSRETRRLTLTSSTHVRSMSEAYSLDARSLSVMRPSNHGSTGTASVTVHGSSLGSAALTAMGRMGQTGCEGTEWESETSVRCLVGHGARSTRRLAMTAGDRSGSMSEAYSFDVTVAGMMSRGNRAGTGSASVTVHGIGLGLVSLTAMGRMGQTGCEGTEWESETSVRCLLDRGAEGTRRVAMTAGERDWTGSAMYTMDVGSLSASRESNRAGTGSARVTVHGAGLGLVSLTAMGRMGQTGCEGTEWESETSVRCLVGHAAWGTRRVAMTACERGGSSSAAMSFDSGSVSVSLQRNRAGTGSASVTVHGSGLGLVSLTAMGRMGQTGCEGTEWESETSVRCLVGHGSRETRRLTLTSSTHVGSMSEAYSLDAHSLSVMRRSNHGSTGTASVTVHGSSLGSAALTAMGRMGQTGCEGTEWESETSVRCLVGHGARGTRRVAMTAGDRSGSMSEAYSSDMTGASMTSRGNRAGTGSASVTVHGSGLGLVSLTAMGRMGQTGCEGTEWESETSVRCSMGHGLFVTRRMAMTAGERGGSSTSATSIDSGSVSVSLQRNRAGTGSASVTVHGAGLGLVSLTAMGRIGQTGCEGTEWESETSVRCLVGLAVPGTRRVAMTAGERGGSSSAAMSLTRGASVYLCSGTGRGRGRRR
jgi:hypothetical protein